MYVFSPCHAFFNLDVVQIINNRIRATTYLCTTSLIRAITPRLGRFLGPQGLMPSERRGTVTDDITGYMDRIQGTSEWRADKQGNIHMPIGTVCIFVPSMAHSSNLSFRCLLTLMRSLETSSTLCSPLKKRLVTSRRAGTRTANKVCIHGTQLSAG